MTKKLITSLAVALMTSTAFAGIVSTTAGDKTVESVQIAKEGTVSIENQQIPVSIVGAGLRKKKIGPFAVKVYVVELLSSDASKFVRTEADALKSMADSRTTVLRMSILKSFDADTVVSAFTEGLQKNGVDTTEKSVAEFLKVVGAGSGAVGGKSLAVVLHQNADKSEDLYYEDCAGKLTKVSGSQGLSQKILSLWLGQSVDAEAQAMKEQIIKGL
jgi:hypothetical protein